MPVNYKIIQAKDFLKAKTSGATDLEESKRMLGQIAEMSRLIGNCEILLDVRDAYGDLDESDIFELILEFGRHRDAFRNKIAVLAREDEQFHKAIFLEMFATIDGFKVMAFTDFEQATNWIEADEGIEGLWK